MRFIHLETVSSTQDEARRLYQAGERGPVCVRADEQVAGRGRLSRRWDSPTGNLFSTLLYPTDALPKDAAFYGFATAVAIARMVEGFDPEAAIALKWPNDVLADGAKISGILIEREVGALLIGTGINLVSHPGNTPYPATHLKAISAKPEEAYAPTTVLPLLMDQMIPLFLTLEREGFAPVREAWLKRAYRLGERVKVGDVHGLFEDVSPDGALCLRLEDGTRREIHTGDVSFG